MNQNWSHWALDSGGFTAHKVDGGFQFTPDDYLHFIDGARPAWAASMDFPCEPELLGAVNMTVEEAINATVELSRFLCRRSDRIVPVLQGYTAEQYEDCWRRLPRTGRVAVGSVCRRQSLPEIRELVRRLREFLGGVGGCGWRHGFGIKLTALRHPDVADFFTSVDSNAWEFWRIHRYRDLTAQGLSFNQQLRMAFWRYTKLVEGMSKKTPQGVLL